MLLDHRVAPGPVVVVKSILIPGLHLRVAVFLCTHYRAIPAS